MTDLLSLSGIYRIEDDPGILGAENFTWPFEYRVEVTRDENDKNLYNIANDVTSGGQYMENFIQIRDNKDGTYNLTYDEYGDGNYQSFDNIDEDVLMQHLDHLVKMDVATKIDELSADEELKEARFDPNSNRPAETLMKELDARGYEVREKIDGRIYVSAIRDVNGYIYSDDEMRSKFRVEVDGWTPERGDFETEFTADSREELYEKLDKELKVKELKESNMSDKVLEESERNSSVYYETLSKLSSLGVATSKIYNQANFGLTVDIEPTDSAINKVVSKLESLGFREVDHYEDDSYRNDSYIVFINEIQGERVVCGIVYNARSNFAFVTAGYDEVEDGEYFEANEGTSKSLKEGLTEDNDSESDETYICAHCGKKIVNGKGHAEDCWTQETLKEDKLNYSPEMKTLKRAIKNIHVDSWEELRALVTDITERVINEEIYGDEEGPEKLEESIKDSAVDRFKANEVDKMSTEEVTREEIINDFLDYKDAADKVTLREGLSIVDELLIKQAELLESKKDKPARKRKRA